MYSISLEVISVPSGLKPSATVLVLFVKIVLESTSEPREDTTKKPQSKHVTTRPWNLIV